MPYRSVSRLPIVYSGVGFSAGFGKEIHVHDVGCCSDYCRNCISACPGQINCASVENLTRQT